MAQTMSQRHFDQSLRHVELGERRVLRQREIVAELERHGHADAARRARELLDTFEQALRLQTEHRAYIASEIATEKS